MFGKKKTGDLIVHVKDTNGSWHEVPAMEGESAMKAITEAKLDMTGSCGGQAACATCHVFVDDGWFSRISEPSEEEIDMLEYAGNQEQNSRLSCQIILSKQLDGIRMEIAGQA